MRLLFSFLFTLSSLFVLGQTFESSNLPIIVINTNSQTISDEPKITAGMKIIYNGQNERNSISDTTYNYNGYIGIELRGNSSLSFDQKQYTIETRDAAGDNLDVSLLGMSKNNDWMLHAPYSDISMIRNIMAYHIWDEMGHWSPATQLVELVINNTYQGVYVLTETVKRDKNRVDIAKLKSTDTSGLALTGGYIMKIDASNSTDDVSFKSKVKGLGTMADKTITWLVHYPDPKEITDAQLAYIHGYIDTVELVLQSENFNDPESGYTKYIGKKSFVDYFIHTELSLNVDGYKRSAYYYKDKQDSAGTGGKLKVGPVWDFNLAYGNCNFCNGNNINAWVYEGCETSPVPTMWMRLMEDSTFCTAVKTRYTELRQGILSDAYLNSFIDDYAQLLNEAQARQFEKWNDLLSDGSPFGGMWDMKFWYCAYRVTSYSAEIDSLKHILSQRLKFLDENLPCSCDSSLFSGTEDKTADKNDLYIYPNPTTSIVKLASSVPLKSIRIYNLTGNLLVEKTVESSTDIVINEFSAFPAGFYSIVCFDTEGKPISKTIIKE